MKHLIMAFVAISVLFMVTVPADAGRGPGSGSPAISKGACITEVTEGDSVTISGLVVMAAITGGGLVIDTGDALEPVYGIGPTWFWEANGMTKPQVGEYVVVDASALELPSGPLTVAFFVTIGEETIQLRDLETGIPLWR